MQTYEIRYFGSTLLAEIRPISQSYAVSTGTSVICSDGIDDGIHNWKQVKHVIIIIIVVTIIIIIIFIIGN